MRWQLANGWESANPALNSSHQAIQHPGNVSLKETRR